MNFVKTIAFLLITVVGGQSATICVSPTSTGSGAGTDWNNKAQWSSSTPVRGDTWYLEDGSYAAKSFTTAASGGTMINIKKATVADHGTSTGWSDTMGDGLSSFTGGLDFGSSNWLFDGQRGGGAVESWTNNFGFKITETLHNCIEVNPGSTVTNLNFRHIEMQGKGSATVGTDSDNNDAYGLYNTRWVTISYGWLHGIGRCPFFVKPADTIIEHVYVQSFFGSVSVHSEVASLWDFSGGTFRDITFRYCLITDIESTGGIMWDNNTATSAQCWIYGNIFYKPSGASWETANGLIGGWTGASSEECHNLRIYNNTFINVDQNTISGNPTIFSGNIAKNNLFYNCDSPDFGIIGTHDYNRFINAGGAHSESNGTSAGSGDPFTDFTNYDFSLTSDTTAGENLGSPFNQDALGNTRTTWTRGAIQFEAGGNPTIQFPLVVLGSNTFSTNVSFYIPSGALVTQLLVLSHAWNYTNKASITIGTNAAFFANKNTFTPVLLSGVMAGGVGGGAHTLWYGHALATNVIKYGQTNTITFKFNDNTNYQSSGYRIIRFELLSRGTNAIPSDTYTWDNPALWAPPYSDSTNIVAGSSLFNNTNLTWRGTNISPHCVDCHAHRGIDLAYFNFDNWAIMVRCIAHGMTTNQGLQVASYIRTRELSNFVTIPTNVYPWTPVYQPTNGLDSRAANSWAAGGGIESVYDTDESTLTDIISAGAISANANINFREQRVFIQMPDWLHWLPMVDPADYWGTNWSNSPAFLKLAEMEARATNAVNLQVCIEEGFADFLDLVGTRIGFPSHPWPVNFQLPYFSAHAMWMTKMWSVRHEFNLETNGVQVFGSLANTRSWSSAWPFRMAPHIAGFDQNDHIFNDSSVETWNYLSAAWYQVQMILHDGAHQQTGNNPVDWPYQLLFAGAVCNTNVGCGGLVLEQLIKALQQYGSDNRAGPWLYNNGWQPINFASAWFLMSDLADGTRPDVWRHTSTALRKSACELYLTEWNRVNRKFIPSMYWTNSPTIFNGTFATATETNPIPNVNAEGGRWIQRYWWLPKTTGQYGLNISPALVSSIISEGALIWPGETNWPSLFTNVTTANTSATVRNLRVLNSKLVNP